MRTGARALVHTNAMARSEPLLVSAFATQERSASSFCSSSSAAQQTGKEETIRPCVATFSSSNVFYDGIGFEACGAGKVSSM